MSDKRRNWSEAEKLILYNQVGGICPMCQKPLYNKKEGKYHKAFQIAHIYPLNPSFEEERILFNEEKLFEKDCNELNNLIALCNNCHSYIDNPTTVDGYRKLADLKKQLIKSQNITDLYSSYTIEEDILKVINCMISGLNESSETIDYNQIKIDDKIQKNNKILNHKIKEDVSYYYLFIKKCFAEIDKTDMTFEIIAGQIKSFYKKISSITSDQNKIYDSIANWIFDKYKVGNIEAYKIIVSFFVQNCEVFENVTK